MSSIIKALILIISFNFAFANIGSAPSSFVTNILSSRPSAQKVSSDNGSSTGTRDLGDLFQNLSRDKDLDAYRNLLRRFLKVCSYGFFIATILKFKQYKDNPTQIPISTPFAFLLVAILSLTAQNMVSPVTKTVFGDSPSGSCTGLPGSGKCDD